MKDPLVTKQPDNSFFAKHTMTLIGLGSAAAYTVFYFQKFDSNNLTGRGLWDAGISIGLITSAFTMVASSCLYRSSSDKRAAESQMTWGQYIPHVAKSMFNPCADPRRFYTFGNFIGNWLLLPAEILNMGNLVTVRCVVEPLYYLAQFTALAGPVKSENSYIAWGAIKGIFQGISLFVSLKEPEKFAPIIAANSIFLATSLFAVASGISTKLAERKEAVSIGV